MGKRDYYRTRDILLGLYGAYEEHQRELEKLKVFCEINEKKVEEFYFDVFKPEFENPILNCEIIKKQNALQHFITHIREIMGLYVIGEGKAIMVNDNNQYHFLCGFKEYPVHIKYNHGANKEFFKQANIILNSQFSKNMNSKCIRKDNLYFTLKIETRYINILIENSSDRFPKSLFWYDPHHNTISFYSYEKNRIIDQEYINNILDIEIPISELNLYQIGLINNSKMTNKPIILENFISDSEIEFNIEDKEKSLVLTNVKK